MFNECLISINSSDETQHIIFIYKYKPKQFNCKTMPFYIERLPVLARYSRADRAVALMYHICKELVLHCENQGWLIDQQNLQDAATERFKGLSLKGDCRLGLWYLGCGDNVDPVLAERISVTRTLNPADLLTSNLP